MDVMVTVVASDPVSVNRIAGCPDHPGSDDVGAPIAPMPMAMNIGARMPRKAHVAHRPPKPDGPISIWTHVPGHPNVPIFHNEWPPIAPMVRPPIIVPVDPGVPIESNRAPESVDPIPVWAHVSVYVDMLLYGGPL